MSRRLCLASVLAALVLPGCGSLTPPWDSAPFVHAVVFKLRSPSEVAVAEMLRDIKDLLAPIPSVKGLWAGRPAPTNDMPFVDTSYDVGLLITFADQKGLREYAGHPRHADFVKKYDGKFDVRVFDFSPAGDMKP